MADSKRYENYGKPTLQQGGWVRTGEGNDYIMYSYTSDPNYYYRICTLEYVPQHHPSQITITGISSKELEVSVLVLRSDNYIISALGWQDNGYTFNLGSTYDKLGIMFRFKNGDAIIPNHVTFDEVGAWLHSLRKLTTATDAITSLPADLYADGTNATVGLVGNMSQTGTPTPSSPITPSECGERTGNLLEPFENYTWTVSNCSIISNVDNTLILNGNGYTGSSFSQAISSFKSVPSSLLGQTVTLSGGIAYESEAVIAPRITLSIERSGEEDYNISIYGGLLNNTFEMPNNATRYRLFARIDQNKSQYVATAQVTYSNVMLNTGSQPLPYQPYGYKLDIKSANTTTPVYLGEVQSTRRIKKLVLTGDEGWQLHSSVANLFRFDINDYLFSESNITLCTHYKSTANTGATGVSNGETCFYYGSSTARIIYIRDNSYSTANDFKTYLAQQYAAGTPVCVWYVLATPQTAVVNEPIRKIGDYADSVSVTGIPTTTGKDTFDVLTTLKPSEVNLTYTGWHDASVKEKSANLFDKDNASIGYYISSSTGEMVENSPSVASDYIPIIQGEEYYWNDPTARGNAGAFYDSNKNYLSGWSTSSLRYVFTAPNGAAYVRLTAAANNINNLQLNTGSRALPYEPYWK